jgi:hypothetical protein
MSAVAILEREVYSEAEAARLLRLSQGTLNYWLELGHGDAMRAAIFTQERRFDELTVHIRRHP